MATKLTDQVRLDRAWAEYRKAQAYVAKYVTKAQALQTGSIAELNAKIIAAGGRPTNGGPTAPYKFDHYGNVAIQASYPEQPGKTASV